MHWCHWLFYKKMQKRLGVGICVIDQKHLCHWPLSLIYTQWPALVSLTKLHLCHWLSVIHTQWLLHFCHCPTCIGVIDQIPKEEWLTWCRVHQVLQLIPEVVSSMRRMGDGCFKSYHGARVDQGDEVGLNVRRPPNHIPCHRYVNTFKPERLITGNWRSDAKLRSNLKFGRWALWQLDLVFYSSSWMIYFDAGLHVRRSWWPRRKGGREAVVIRSFLLSMKH